MAINIEQIKKLKEETGSGVVEAKEALEKNDDNYEKALAELMEKASAKAAKKQDRIAKDGLVYSYIHGRGKIGSMVQIGCETDFVAKTEDFKQLCHEIALQVATEEFEDLESLLASEYVRDSSKTIQDLVNETTAKVGEKIEIQKFTRFAIM